MLEVISSPAQIRYRSTHTVNVSLSANIVLLNKWNILS